MDRPSTSSRTGSSRGRGGPRLAVESDGSTRYVPGRGSRPRPQSPQKGVLEFLAGIEEKSREGLIQRARDSGLWVKTTAGENRALLVRHRTNKGGRTLRPTYLQQCANGIVVDMETMAPLSIPPRSFTFNVRSSHINNYLMASPSRGGNPYEITEAHDGTIVTLYRYGGKWCLSSANGYDISDYTWIGEKTWAQAFVGAVRGGVPGSEEFVSLDEHGSIQIRGLPERYYKPSVACWTIGISSPDFHALAEAPRAWLVHQTDLATGERTDAIEEVLRWVAPPKAGPAFRTLAEYGADVAEVEGRPISFAGYVFRSRDPARTREYSDFLIEAPRMAVARKLLYSRPSEAVAAALDRNTRPIHKGVVCWTRGRTAEYLELFPGDHPRGKALIDQIARTHADLASEVYSILVSRLASGPAPDGTGRLEELATRVDGCIRAHLDGESGLTGEHGVRLVEDALKTGLFVMDLVEALDPETDGNAEAPGETTSRPEKETDATRSDDEGGASGGAGSA
jgi:hypothetical protein